MARPRSLKARASETVLRLSKEYPGSARDLCALSHDGPFQLLVATILSAQCTDEMVNQVTPKLFAACPAPVDLARADPTLLEGIIRPTGFFRSKVRNLQGMSSALVERFGGDVPASMEDLTSLPGVGRKTANVVRSVAFGLPGLPVDTHVGRLVRRLGFTSATDPDKVELEMNALVPEEARGALSLRLILHGRRICKARLPRCPDCVLNDLCPSAELGTVRRVSSGRAK